MQGEFDLRLRGNAVKCGEVTQVVDLSSERHAGIIYLNYEIALGELGEPGRYLGGIHLAVLVAVGLGPQRRSQQRSQLQAHMNA